MEARTRRNIECIFPQCSAHLLKEYFPSCYFFKGENLGPCDQVGGHWVRTRQQGLAFGLSGGPF